MYRLIRVNGVVTGVEKLNADGSTINATKRHPLWQNFLDWREKLPPEEKAQYDLSDQPPPAPPVDTDLNAIDALIAKDDGGTATNADRFELVLRAVKRLRRRGAL